MNKVISVQIPNETSFMNWMVLLHNLEEEEWKKKDV